MFKYLILALMLLLAVPAVAEENNGPDYVSIIANGDVILNANYLTTPPMKLTMYLYSASYSCSVEGYRFNRNTQAFVKVFPASATSVPVISGLVMPITGKYDKLVITNLTGTISATIYK